LSVEVGERLIHAAAEVKNLMVFAPLVARGLSERFAANHVNFVDLAGNCHVDVAGRYFAHVEGRKVAVRAASLRALRAPTYRVLFALLVESRLLQAPARLLADAAGGVSPQTALDARKMLFQRGFLNGDPARPTWAQDGRLGTLELFVSGFANTLLPSLALGRFRLRDAHSGAGGNGLLNGGTDVMERALTGPLRESAWRWGGGAAAERLTDVPRNEKLTLYLARASDARLVDLALEPDPDGEIMMVERPCALAFESSHPDTIHPLLAYAELVGERDARSIQGARALHARYVAALVRL
jgi:hypothetical protein